AMGNTNLFDGYSSFRKEGEAGFRVHKGEGTWQRVADTVAGTEARYSHPQLQAGTESQPEAGKWDADGGLEEGCCGMFFCMLLIGLAWSLTLLRLEVSRSCAYLKLAWFGHLRQESWQNSIWRNKGIVDFRISHWSFGCSDTGLCWLHSLSVIHHTPLSSFLLCPLSYEVIV
ncbi:hypothetical protein STEG23_004200, partial [Scotinomys teguina]